MKARLSAILCLIVTILLSLGGMTSSASVGQYGPPPVELTLGQLNDGQVVELEEDELLVLRLESNPATGYGWGVQQMNPAVLRKLDGEEFEAKSDLLGAPGTQVLRFAGAGRGQTNLALAYRRPWEVGKPPAKTFSVQVRSRGAFRGRYAPPPAAEKGGLPVLSAEGDAAPATSSESSVGASASDAYFNWCDLGGCPSVKNQGSCGSCWAFATVGPLESLILIRDGVEKDLSEQYLVSCNADGWSCNGGWWAHDYHEWKYVTGEFDAGARYEVDFPYSASNALCDPPHPSDEKIVDWQQLAYGVATVEQIKQAIVDHGPVTTAVCVNTAFQSYKSGVFTGPSCTSINHGVVLVGWDDSKGAWRMRNSWGPAWGEAGYMWIGYGVSQIGYRTTYVVYNSGQNVPPTAGFDYLCSGLSCDFASSSSDLDGTIASHGWDFGDGSSGSGQTASHTYAAGGTYAVTLTVTDDGGATGSNTQTVAVTEPASVHVSDLAGSSVDVNKKFWKAEVTVAVHDAGEAPVVNATVSGSWSGAASGSGSCLTDVGGRCTIASPQLSKSAGGTETFTVGGVVHSAFVYDPAANHESSIDVTLGRESTNQPPAASFAYTCDGAALACTFDASGSSDPDGSITAYAWDFGDAGTGSGQVTGHTYGAAGTYTVRLTVTDDRGATGEQSQQVPVGVDPPTIYVQDVTLSGSTAGANRLATAVVTIFDTGGSRVAGATVYGTWSGDYGGTDSGVTGADGTVSLTSGRVKQKSASFTFTVDDVVKSGSVYDPTLNVKASGSVVVP